MFSIHISKNSKHHILLNPCPWIIAEYLGKKFDKFKILNAIKKSSFDNLKKKEQIYGFKEAPKYLNNSKTFFNLGPKNDWKKIINREISKRIEREFEREMLELNYLD